MILMEMMLEVVIGVLVMEVDKVADEVTDMEVDKVADMKIPIEDLTEVILAIGYTYRDDVRSGRWPTCRTNTSYMAAKFLTNKSGTTW